MYIPLTFHICLYTNDLGVFLDDCSCHDLGVFLENCTCHHLEVLLENCSCQYSHLLYLYIGYYYIHVDFPFLLWMIAIIHTMSFYFTLISRSQLRLFIFVYHGSCETYITNHFRDSRKNSSFLFWCRH
jgi:hypothetical protein